MFQRLTIKSPVYSGNDYFAVADTDGFAAEAAKHPRNQDRSWLGGMSYEEAAKAAYEGYAAGLVESDAMLDKFSDLDLASRRWRTFDAVAGGAPNIGAYLAGSPLSMRRRERQLSDAAPLNVFCDVMSSAAIDVSSLKNRGVAVLALVRALSATRPTTVYMVGGDGSAPTTPAAFCAVRMDNPMDLSRAAFFLGHPGAARGLLYSTLKHGLGCPISTGSWAWGSVNEYRKHAPRLFSQAVGTPLDDCLYLAPPHTGDKAISDPVAWVRDMLATYGGAPIQNAA